jgi:hypothetical protein
MDQTKVSNDRRLDRRSFLDAAGPSCRQGPARGVVGDYAHLNCFLLPAIRSQSATWASASCVSWPPRPGVAVFP